MTSDRLIAWVRTTVPALWSALIAWAATRGVPQGVLDAVGGLVEPLLVPLVLAAVYAALRWLEPRLPAWLAVVLLGSAKTPTYRATGGTVSVSAVRHVDEHGPGLVRPSTDVPDHGR